MHDADTETRPAEKKDQGGNTEMTRRELPQHEPANIYSYYCSSQWDEPGSKFTAPPPFVDAPIFLSALTGRAKNVNPAKFTFSAPYVSMICAAQKSSVTGKVEACKRAMHAARVGFDDEIKLTGLH